MRALYKFLIFCLIGGFAFLIDFGFFNLFYYFGIGFVVAATFSWIISMVFNFIINRNVTFSARGYSVKQQILKWIVVYFIAFLVKIGSGKLLLFFIGENALTANIAFIFGLAISIPISFFGSLLWAFRKS